MLLNRCIEVTRDFPAIYRDLGGFLTYFEQSDTTLGTAGVSSLNHGPIRTKSAIFLLKSRFQEADMFLGKTVNDVIDRSGNKPQTADDRGFFYQLTLEMVRWSAQNPRSACDLPSIGLLINCAGTGSKMANQDFFFSCGLNSSIIRSSKVCHGFSALSVREGPSRNSSDTCRIHTNRDFIRENSAISPGLDRSRPQVHCLRDGCLYCT